MAPKFRNRLAVLTLAAALGISTVTPVFADDGSASQATDQSVSDKSIGTVSIGTNQSLELKNASVLSGDNGKIVTFTVTVHNDSDSELSFIDYWLRLLGSGGTEYTVNVMDSDKDKNKVPAHSSMDVGYYATVDSGTNLSDLTFRFIRWDFNAANYESTMGEITIPSDYTNVTPIGQTTRFDVSGTSMESTVGKLVVNQNDDYYLASAYLNIENVGMKKADLDAAKYVYAIQTSEGYLYNLSKANANTSLALAPLVKQQLVLNASIPKQVSPDNWKLLIIDASNTPNLPVATFELPSANASDASATPSDAASIDVNGTPVGAFIKRVSVGKTDTSNMTSVFFTFQNNGVKTETLSGYQFALVTKDGLTYPLASQTDFSKGISLNPRSSQSVQLSVNIPSSVDTSGMKLQLIQGGANDQLNYPIATFNVPQATTSDVSVGIEYPFTDSVGSYGAKLDALQRTPLDDNDILSADLSLANKGDALLPLPSLQAYYLLDGNVKINASLAPLDKVNSIAVGSSVQYTAAAVIPYTTTFSTIQLVLQEKDASSDSSNAAYATVAEFKNSADLLQMPVIAKGDTYKIADIGKRAEVQPTLVQTYTGPSDTNLYYVELQMTNEEKRFSDMADLQAYLKTKDDLYFPATITSVSNAVSPKGKATVALWAKLPNTYTMADLDVIVGEAQKIGDTAAYVHAADMKLPDEVAAANSSFSNMTIGGYTLSLSDIKTTPSVTQGVPFNLSLSYTLAKNDGLLPELSDSMPKHKLILQVTTSQGQQVEKTVDFNNTVSPINFTTGTSTSTIAFSNPDVNFLAKALQSSGYTLNVYDDFGGYRKLLGTGNFNWFN